MSHPALLILTKESLYTAGLAHLPSVDGDPAALFLQHARRLRDELAELLWETPAPDARRLLPTLRLLKQSFRELAALPPPALREHRDSLDRLGRDFAKLCRRCPHDRLVRTSLHPATVQLVSMDRLNMLFAVLTPPSLLAGFYGVNFAYFQKKAASPLAFYLGLASLPIASLLGYLFVRVPSTAASLPVVPPANSATPAAPSGRPGPGRRPK